MQDLPSERSYHGSAVVNNTLYLIGGEGNKNIDKYDAATKSFVTVKSLDTARSDFGICNYNDNSIIVAGGRIDGEKTSTSFLYNTSSNKIKKLGELNEKKSGLVLVNCLGTVFSVGGCNFGKNIEKFSPLENKWKTTKSSLNIGRFQPGAVAHKEFIYIFGGHNEHRKMVSSIEKFNTKTGEVTTIESKLLIPRNCFASYKIFSDVYIIGGDTFDYSTIIPANNNSGYTQQLAITIKKNVLDFINHFTNTTEIFNLNSEEIRQGISFPVSDEGFTAGVLVNI